MERRSYQTVGSFFLLAGTCVPSLAYPHSVLLGFDSPRKTWTAERPIPVSVRNRNVRVTRRNTTTTAIRQSAETPTSPNTRRSQTDAEASFAASSRACACRYFSWPAYGGVISNSSVLDIFPVPISISTFNRPFQG
mgnify:CR=1 FL=1